MNHNKINENFKLAPLGLKLIIVLYGAITALDFVYLFDEFNLDRIVALILSLLSTIGFLFRWEAVRLIYRFLIGSFFLTAVVMIFVSDKFRASALENAVYWAIAWIVPIVMFFYLGRAELKKLFKGNGNEDDPTRTVDADAT